ncbi:MAG: hypothetical protein WD024_03470 [Bacillota bacterium]
MPSGRLLLQIPADLICDPRLPPLAKALYMTLVQLGPCSLRELSAASQVNRETVRRLVGALARAGWAMVTGGRNRRVVVASRPEKTQRDLVDHLREMRSVFNPVGENLSKLLLNVGVDDDRYVENARPHFLQNPRTGEYLELDRWYHERRVGEEYQGIQHFMVTSTSDEKNLKEIQARDAMKAELCRAKGVALMIVTEDDLSLDGILAKLPPQLPRAHIDRSDLYVRALEEFCEEYVASCRRIRAREESKNRRDDKE